MLYASSTLSLACLEILVHIKEPRLPIDYASARFEIPEDVIEPAPLLAVDINDSEMCAATGTRWIESGRLAAALVPSVIIPTELNILLNPAHPAFERVGISGVTGFLFDPRLLKLGPTPL